MAHLELSSGYCRATSRIEDRSARFIAIINLRSQMEVGSGSPCKGRCDLKGISG
jgi:hypothetical protein